MTNNDILRALRYALDISDSKLLACFASQGVVLPPAQLMAVLKHEDEPGFQPLSDAHFGSFLDGFIEQRRGKRESGSEGPALALAMNNNRVLRALKIALSLKDVDVIAVMELSGLPVSKSEVSALFRREGHPNFQPCGDQFLRNFLRGLGIRHRGSLATE